MAVVAGVVLALVLSGGDDDDKGTSASATSETAATTERTTAERTETSTDNTTTETAPARKQDTKRIERAVATFVELAEQSDPAACSQVAGGEGMQLEQCAGKAGIDLRTLPSSDEFDISAVDVAGNRATVKLSNGAAFTLAKTGGRWKITGYKPFR